MISIDLIQSEDVAVNWTDAAGWVELAISEGATRDGVTSDAVKRSCMAGIAHLWLVRETLEVVRQDLHTIGAVVAEIVETTAWGRFCSLTVARGYSLERYAGRILREVEAWAKSEGCNRVVSVSNSAWSQVAVEQEGYQLAACVIERSLTHSEESPC